MTAAAPPTNGEVTTALRLEGEHRAAKPTTPEQVEEVQERLIRDWQAENHTGTPTPDIQSFIRGVAAKASVTNEDRGDVRAFWSYRSQPEGAPSEVGHRYLAQACGETRNYQVLEDSPAGKQLDSYHLWEPEVREMLTRDFDVAPSEAKALAPEVWSTVSRRYAEAAKGPVVVFAADIGEESVLGKDELPQLLAHQRVGKEGVEFALPSPRHEHLPRDVDELIADDAVRCQVRMEDFDPKKTTPKEFAQKLGAIDVPEHRRAEHQAALSRLMSADRYADLDAPPAASTRSGPDRAHGFMQGVDIPAKVALPGPGRPSGHGVYNPVPELVPRAPGVER
ncbi:hypothetical protein [Streptomyces sp. ISL-94]|uniref:hypothetical protein n=1 Tax=Streptomyces sp. ISL-94 TaxID=2819190 RepID=UPI001BE826A4|nr:hypothetical protein [Streptomyces sp. ISL-94]MBT2482932.1 hypothetical protein [Streptomyces sp. ISL-94]